MQVGEELVTVYSLDDLAGLLEVARSKFTLYMFFIFSINVPVVYIT